MKAAPRQTGDTIKILVSGSSGFIGAALLPRLQKSGHQVVRLVRSPAQAGGIVWNPAAGKLDAARLEGFGAVIHLAGENVAGRWTAAKKKRIHDSRAGGTRLLCEALATLKTPPRVLVSASATGFYGNRGDEVLREDSAAGTGFFPAVCRAWEDATVAAREAGIRVVNLRIGIVLSRDGGALPKMLPAFRLGLGGPIGSGRQFWGWISLDDTLGIIEHALEDEALRGPVNAVAGAVRSREFARTLGRVLRRPAILAAPAFALRLMLGEMADEALLASTRVEPACLRAAGYSFQHPDLEDALRPKIGHIA